MTVLKNMVDNRKERLKACEEMLEAATERFDSATKALETSKQRVRVAQEEYVQAQIAVDRNEG